MTQYQEINCRPNHALRVSSDLFGKLEFTLLKTFKSKDGASMKKIIADFKDPVAYFSTLPFIHNLPVQAEVFPHLSLSILSWVRPTLILVDKAALKDHPEIIRWINSISSANNEDIYALAIKWDA